MKKIILTISISIITIIILLSFIDRTPKQVSNNTADIVYSINSIPTNLKSIGDLDKRQQDIVCATSKGLVEMDSEGNIQPSLAESYEINEDGLEYVFKVRGDVYWSNGDKITPEDIVSFFRQVITEDNEISALLNVYGVKDYLESDKSFSEAVAITYDENSIKIRLNSKDDGFIEELTKPQYRVRKGVLLWEDIALNYKDKLENWRVRFVKILKNISDCFDYKEENCSKKEYEDYLSSHQKMFDLLYKDSNYDLVHYNSEVFIKELNISESTNIEI